MYKITLAILFFCCSFIQLNAQTAPADTAPLNIEEDIALIKDFIAEVADESQRADIILAKYVAIEQTHTDEGYDYLEASIEEIRLNLQPKNLDEIEYIPFRALPKRETRDIDPEGKPTDRMYFLHYKERQMLAVYLADNKIASFTLVSKGDRAHFVTY